MKWVECSFFFFLSFYGRGIFFFSTRMSWHPYELRLFCHGHAHWCDCDRHDQLRTAVVDWRPSDIGLHYHKLYISIWEYLRQPPSREHLTAAQAYLDSLMQYPNVSRLQRDRIRWTRAWIDGVRFAEAG
jgi:hypothetical protein